MTKQIRDLLDQAALEPSRPVDVESCRRAGRTRQRRVGVVVGLVAAIVVVGGAVALTASGDATSVRTPVTAPPESNDGLPDGWHRIESEERGLSIAVPPDWQEITHEVQFVTFGVGTKSAGQAFDDVCESGVVAAVRDVEVVLVETVFEGSDGPEPLIDPRTNFAGATPHELGPCFETFFFRDAGRFFEARVAVRSAATDGLRLGREILNTLRVEPRTMEEPTSTVPNAITTTTLAVTPSLSPPVTTVPSPEVEAASAAVLGWLNSEPPDPGAAYIEDYEAIADLLRAGQAQHSPEALAAFSGRVESATVIGADRVEVRYTVLQYGRPLFPNLAGAVVRIDGTWKVSRETVCALLSRGGITCPPRAG